MLGLALLLLPVAPALAVTVERVVSPLGIEAWLVRDHTNPIISMSFAFRGGAITDPPGKAGRAYMAGALLDEGAGDMDSWPSRPGWRICPFGCPSPPDATISAAA